MAWRQRGDKPLPELMLTQFTDPYIHIYVALGGGELSQTDALSQVH